MEDNENTEDLILITCSSSGTISIWRVSCEEMMSIKPSPDQKELEGSKAAIRQVGRLLGSYETDERITCLKAFVMQEADEPSGVDGDDGELDFDAFYPDDTPKSDSGEDGATSDDSSDEVGP